ncbi:Septum formation [Actinokineospora alba]|uniref:Septum formation n=1 Tax=Actinokineospora alba TaxID=504798 RepID=A0A1H0WLI4_9PSEU|nr:septum formation family protein [Actinokineospora alba]TDP66261.1 putative regulator of septum formation [Actinokineospora alba]SDJ44246.1 Septum formation [Actinokineospora alba]SDP91572.1 Septum formation [Actinokineospora alba]
MAGAFAGALILLCSSILFSWPVEAGRNDPVAVAQEERRKAFDSPAGSCLQWTPPEGADMRRVDCAQAHLFEVTSNVDISGEYPENAPPPDTEKWQAIAVAKCTPGAVTYLGGNLDPFGKFSVNALKPTNEQWDEGDRKVRCGLQSAAPSGALLTTVGSAARQDQSKIHEPGTCLALVGQEIGDPVACDQAHAFEIVGNVDLGAAFPADYPAVEAQTERASDLCAAVTTAYTGGADLAKKGLTPYPDTLRPESWAAGSRKVDCRVGAKLPDGSGLAPVTGSVRAVPATTPPASQPPASQPPPGAPTPSGG